MLHHRRQQTGLVELIDAVGQQASGEEDEEDAGDVEEEAKANAPSSSIEGVAQGQRPRQSQAGPQSGLDGRGGAGGGEHEERRLDALAQDGDEGDGGQCQGRPHGQRRLHLHLKATPDVDRLALHPDDHPAKDGDGGEHGGAVEDLLRPALELPGGDEDDGAHQKAEANSGGGTQEDMLPVGALAGVAQVSEDDHHNEARLQPLPQRYQQ